jgi:hypothetical protein
LKNTLLYLSGKYRGMLIRPQEVSLDKISLDYVDSILRKVDTICFYIEEKLQSAQQQKTN